MALDQARVADPDETGLLAQLGEGRRAAVAHPGLQAADELVEEVADRASVRHAPLYALGHELVPGGAGLAVALRAALHHRAEGAHPPERLERPSHVEDLLAGALL